MTVQSLDLAVRVFRCFQHDHEQLYWMIEDGSLCLCASETTFVWGLYHYPRYEDITEQNIAVLEQSRVDLLTTGDNDALSWVAALFISRVNKDRPKRSQLDSMKPKTRALFEAIVL